MLVVAAGIVSFFKSRAAVEGVGADVFDRASKGYAAELAAVGESFLTDGGDIASYRDFRDGGIIPGKRRRQWRLL